MSDRPKPTVPNLRARKRRDGGVPIVMVTAYDGPGARIVSEAGADIILVGDSVANTVLGYEDTLHVDIDVMAHHTAAVARAKPRSLILGDTHHYDRTHQPFDNEEIAELLLREGSRLLGAKLTVRSRWRGIYAESPATDFLIAWPQPGTAAVSVTSGIGMTTALGLAPAVLDQLL